MGTSLSGTVSKSGINHRLRKLADIADGLRGGVAYDKVKR